MNSQPFIYGRSYQSLGFSGNFAYRGNRFSEQLPFERPVAPKTRPDGYLYRSARSFTARLLSKPTALEEVEIWEDLGAPPIRAMAEDIHLPRFGLNPPQFTPLCQRVDAVHHLAASLSVATPYVSLRRTNVFSIHGILDLCLATRLKHIIFASTIGVFPKYFYGYANQYSGSRITHQMQPDIASMKRAFPLGLPKYPWTQAVVEQAVLHVTRYQRAGVTILPAAHERREFWFRQCRQCSGANCGCGSGYGTDAGGVHVSMEPGGNRQRVLIWNK